jgi:hypothetical protein
MLQITTEENKLSFFYLFVIENILIEKFKGFEKN